MLFRSADLDAIFSGRVTLAFRRSKRITVKAGGTQRTQHGLLAIDEVHEVDPDRIPDADARAAGYESTAALVASMEGREGRWFRVRLRPGGPDPRDALRADDQLTPADIKTLRSRLDAMDQRAEAPWTRKALELIRDQPGVVSTVLAPQCGLPRMEFKERVRRLKAQGLTISLEVGYRLSPRGEALLAALAREA